MFPIQNNQKIMMDINASTTRKSTSKPVGFSDILSEKISTSTSMDSIFQKASEQYNVPANLLQAVAKSESNFNPNAVSHSGAIGVMQLMPKTAEYLGVRDSFDAEQNIMGGAKYLSGLIEKYDGNTTLALAAYNAGSGNVAKYGGVPPFKETKNYIEKVMAYTKESMDTSVFSATKSTSGTVKKIAEDIYNFSAFSNEDYLLFIERLKLQMNNSLHQDYSNELLRNNIQVLY
ncbi:MAG: lytic transglycosylase domain-containing protein [Proteocatella sp.]